MTKFLFTIFLMSILVSCGNNTCNPDINTKPMFGQVKKCNEQIEADSRFLKRMDEIFEGDRKKAAQERIDKAWEYFYANKLDSSMMRFNQAWLLDSLNAEIYWGFGNLLGRQQKFEESIKYLEKSLKMNPENPNAWLSASTSYGQLFYQSKDVSLLNKSIHYLKKSVSLDPNNAQAYGQLTAAYTHFMQKDSARKYLKMTDRLNPAAVNPEVREILEGQ